MTLGALTNYYTDPAGGSDITGNGTIGNPWATVQKALNTITRDATNGDQINVKAGGTDALVAALTWATYGTPTETAPCILRGYTSVANDGGIGVVSGNGLVACINSGSLAQIKLIDMRFTNCGSATILTLGAGTLVVNCEIDTTTGSGISAAGGFFNNFIHNISTTGIAAGASSRIAFNTFRNSTNDFTQAISTNQTSAVLFNIIDLDGASHGILINGDNTLTMLNSVFSNGGTGTGIRNASTGDQNAAIMNNTVEGFSGSGGIGILAAGTNSDIVAYNLLYNNATNVSITGDENSGLGNNSTAGSSPFINAGSDDFDPIAGLLALYPSYPTTWKSYGSTQQNLIRMAAQYAASAAGGGPLIGGRLVK